MSDNIQIKRDVNIDVILGKYKCISAYKVPNNVEEWENCPNCGLKPLTWEYNNGRSTACGCGKNEYDHFSIVAESIMSYVTRNNGSALDYKTHELKDNWNYWANTGFFIETYSGLREKGMW
jgi:hypothetical protein